MSLAFWVQNKNEKLIIFFSFLFCFSWCFLVLRLLKDGKNSFAVQEITLTKLFHYFKGKNCCSANNRKEAFWVQKQNEKKFISFFCGFGFMTLSRLFYLVRADHYQRWAKPEVPEKNHLTFHCRTWRLTCCPRKTTWPSIAELGVSHVVARTYSGERPMVKSQRSHPLGHGSPKRYYLTDRNNMTYAF